MLPPMRVAVILLALVSAGCTRTEGEPPSAAEQPLIEYLTRDSGVRMVGRWRGERGHLHVLTRQGRKEAEYVIMPGASGALELRRMSDGLILETSAR